MLSRRNFQLFSTWTLYDLLVCYTVVMNHKGIEILTKVKADLAWLQRRLRISSDSIEREILENLIEQNKAWLAEWEAQDRLAVQNNS